MTTRDQLMALLNSQHDQNLVHCDVGALFFTSSSPYSEFHSQGRWMTQEQQGSPLPDLFIDVQEPGSTSKRAVKLVTGRAGQIVYSREIKPSIGAEFRFRTSLVDSVTSFDKGTSKSLRLIRPQVGYRDLESEWSDASELDIEDNGRLFEQALRFLFDRPNARPGMTVNITVPGLQALEYTRGSPFSSEIITVFASLVSTSDLTPEGPPVFVVVEDIDDLATGAATTQLTASEDHNGVPADGRVVLGTSVPTVSQAAATPGASTLISPLQARWQRPQVQMMHRLQGKGFCSHVLHIETASTESNVFFRAAQAEECLVCGEHINPRTEKSIRQHYRDHRSRLANLENQQQDQYIDPVLLTNARSGSSGEQSHIPPRPLLPLDNILARLRQYTPSSAKTTVHGLHQASNPTMNPSMLHNQNLATDTSANPPPAPPAPPAPTPLPPSPSISNSKQSAITLCPICDKPLSTFSNCIDMIAHYTNHRNELHASRIALSSSETEAEGLRTRLELATRENAAEVAALEKKLQVARMISGQAKATLSVEGDARRSDRASAPLAPSPLPPQQEQVQQQQENRNGKERGDAKEEKTLLYCNICLKCLYSLGDKEKNQHIQFCNTTIDAILSLTKTQAMRIRKERAKEGSVRPGSRVRSIPSGEKRKREGDDHDDGEEAAQDNEELGRSKRVRYHLRIRQVAVSQTARGKRKRVEEHDDGDGSGPVQAKKKTES